MIMKLIKNKKKKIKQISKIYNNKNNNNNNMSKKILLKVLKVKLRIINSLRLKRMTKKHQIIKIKNY